MLRFFNKITPWLVSLSIIGYFIEAQLKTSDSLSGPLFFLWLERSIALFFTFEFFYRAKKEKQYLNSAFCVIDLLAIIPFWLGFIVPINWLGAIRACRILRLAKFFRNSRHLQLIALAFYKSWPHMKSLCIVFIMLGLFNTVLIHELEKNIQPESFGELFDCAWYFLVSATTVGYGDRSPITYMGKLTSCIFLLLPSLMIYAGIVGIVGSKFSDIISDEIDPNIDPIELFKIEQQKQNKTIRQY